MVRKILVATVAVIAAVFASVPPSVNAQVSAANYSVDSTPINFYADSFAVVYLSGLDVTADYIWFVQGMNPVTNQPQESLHVEYSSGSATATIALSGVQILKSDGTPWVGPVRIADNFGQVIWKGFIGPVTTADWRANNGSANVGIGYNLPTLDVDAAGWFHPVDQHEMVTVPAGDWTLLHFQYALGSLPTTDEVRVYEIANGTLIGTFPVTDLIEAITPDGTAQPTTTLNVNSFVVLNSSTDTLAFIDAGEDSTAWTGDNPQELGIDYGAFDYEITTAGGANVSDGQSVFMVSRSNFNWRISSKRTQVTPGGTLSFDLVSLTEGVQDSSYGDQELDDSIIGSIDTADYAWTAVRSDSFTVDSLPVQNGLVTWTVLPTVTNMTTAVLGERTFTVELAYFITDGLSLNDRFTNTLVGIGFDTQFGRTLALCILLLGTMVFARSQNAKGTAAFGFIYLFVGGGWILLGLADTLTTLLFSLGALVVLVSIARQVGGQNDY